MTSNIPSRPTEQSRRRRSRRVRVRLKLNTPREWLLAAGGILLMIYGLSTLWNQMATIQNNGSTDVVTDARSLEVDDLLPLTKPVNPIEGWHDMSRLPDPSQAGQTVPDDQPQPNVDVPITGYDSGSIPSGPGNVSQVFHIQNTGTEVLEISNVTTSCSCTRANLSSSVIPPGTRAELTAIFDPDYHATEGPVKRVIWLETNDPDQPVVEVSFTANVWK